MMTGLSIKSIITLLSRRHIENEKVARSVPASLKPKGTI